MPYELKPITVKPGVAPTADFTPQSTPHYNYADKIRFLDGFPEKIGGWQTLLISGPFGLNGCARNVYSYVLNNVIYYLVGTHTNLYSIQGNALYNATPVKATATTLNNVMGTYYATLAANPFGITIGTKTVTVTDIGHPFVDGDVVQFSGATTFGGIPIGELNTSVTISSTTANTYQFSTTTTATSTATGGGAAVVRASRIVSVLDSNTFRDGDNITIVGPAAAVGGIPVADIEGIRVIRNVTSSGYDISADAFATSSVSAAGGSVDIYEEIDDGLLNSTAGSGYGMGLYGVGLYGVSKTSSNPSLPRIWSFDRFGNLVVTTPGNQGGLYSWSSSRSTLPALVSGAPTAINYTFVSDNICVTLGASATPNRIKWCDQGNLTTWTATAQNQAGEDDIEGAGEFLSHSQLRGFNLLHTQEAVYSFRYIGKPLVWETKLIDSTAGLIARNARIVVNGVAYWMGLQDFHMYRGGNVEIVPSNSTDESTMKAYVFNDINMGSLAKIFCWYNSAFNEIWWHYPSSGSNECDRVVRYHVLDKTWTMDTHDRTAGEYPAPAQANPYLANYDATAVDSTVYQHEYGTDADGEPLRWSLRTPYFQTGAMGTVFLGGVYPDHNLSNGDVEVTINSKLYPKQDPATVTYTLSDTDANLIFRRNCRYWQYELAGETLGQTWRAGVWMELFKKGNYR